MAALRLILSSALVRAGAYGGAAWGPLDAGGASATFQAASSKLGALEARLQQMQVENKQALKSHRAMYEENLRSKRDANVKLAFQNTAIAKKARSWQALNAELCKKAQDYSHDLELWQHDWEGVRLNITAAMETSTSTLALLSNYTQSPEMHVLHELDREQARQEAAEEHASHLGEFWQPATGTPTALMQTASVRKRPSESFFKTIEEGMLQMSADQEKEESKLMEHFFQLQQQETKRHEGLVLEQLRLNATCVSMSELHDRLVLAIEHLQGLNGQLAKRGHAVRAFVSRLGTRPLPSADEREGDRAEAPAQVDDLSLPEGGLAPPMAEPVAPEGIPPAAAEEGEQTAPRAKRMESLVAGPAAPGDVVQSSQVPAMEQLRKPQQAPGGEARPSRFAWWVR